MVIPTSRRDFLKRVGQAGGYSAAFAAMQALELGPAAAKAASVPDLPRNIGAGKSVAILGGGIAGLVSAYEMGKAGFTCTVLEARERPGGRNWTIRNGTTVEFTDGTKQTAAWGPDSYFNCGPARLPSIHKTMLNYCKELGVQLEVEINTSRSALLVSEDAFDGKPVEMRQAVNDTRGHVAELLAKCINQNALDEEFSAEDRERMLAFLYRYGDLSRDLKYEGSERAGLRQLPGAGPLEPERRKPLSMEALLDANFWNGILFEEGLDQQATMFQPVGGMDRIPYAFAAKLGDTVQYQSRITEIRKTPDGVRILYSQGGMAKQLEADYCICALPIVTMRDIPNDFSEEVQVAIQGTSYADAYKIAWEAPRFWETENNIYGGISFLSTGPINLVWYPSAKPFTDTGVVVSGYQMERGSGIAGMAIDEKFSASRAAVERLHPGFGGMLRQPIYMNWGKVPYSLGSWVARSGGYESGAYQALTKPDGPFYFAGTHCSRVGAWQEGAALAAHRAMEMLAERIRAEAVATSG